MRQQKAVSGFTLLELVVGMAILAIGMSLFAAMIYPQIRNSFAPVQQVKAAEFAQSLLSEIMSQPYDEQTPVGGVPRCDSTTNSCTVAANLGTDANDDLDGDGVITRDEFDDVDDYQAFCNADQNAADVTGSTSGFTDAGGGVVFNYRVCVIYDGDYDGTADANQTAKLIMVQVTPPQVGGTSGAAAGARINPVTLAAYRGNY